MAAGEARYLNGGGQTRGMLVALAGRGWGPHTLCLLASAGPLPSAGQAAPARWALHGPACHPRLTPSTEPPCPGSSPWVGAGPTRRLPRVSLHAAGGPSLGAGTGSLHAGGGGGTHSLSHIDLGNPSCPQVGTIPERPGWSGAPSPQAAEMRGGRSPRPGRCSSGPVGVQVELGRGGGAGLTSLGWPVAPWDSGRFPGSQPSFLTR